MTGGEGDFVVACGNCCSCGAVITGCESVSELSAVEGIAEVLVVVSDRDFTNVVEKTKRRRYEEKAKHKKI